MQDIYNSNQEIHIDRGTRKLVVRSRQDATPILEQNKIFRNHIPEAQKGDFQRIAQIPVIALKLKTKERFGHSNFYKLDNEQQKDLKFYEQEQNPSFVNSLFEWSDYTIDESSAKWKKQAYNNSITGMAYQMYHGKHHKLY